MEAAKIYKNDPLYHKVMGYFQLGKWQSGLEEINQLLEKYPEEQELQSLQQEMQYRVHYDVDEKAYTSKIRIRKVRKYGTRLLIAIFVIFIFAWGFNSYNNWFQNRTTNIRLSFENEFRKYDLNTKYNNAQQLLAAYRPVEAMSILEEIQAQDEDYPDLEQMKNEAQELIALDAQYSQAITKKQAGDFVGASIIFEEIERQYPNYRDVTLQTRDIQRQFSITDLVALADASARERNWDDAITKYKEVRNLDPLYEPGSIEEKLYNSYLSAAKQMLDDNPESLEALEIALDYYNNALSLRPQDTTVKEEVTAARSSLGDRLFNKYIELAQSSLIGETDSLEGLLKADQFLANAQRIRPDNQSIAQERTMARAYMKAQNEFNVMNWDGVIENLLPIYQIEPDYAGGTARQTLYDAYILRGDYNLRSGKPQLALDDYQQAVAIAELRPEARIRLFESLVKIADVMGVIGNYQAAVFQYRAAMDLANINEIVMLNLDLIEPINQAEEFIISASYKQAYNIYHEAMQEIITKMGTETHEVESGEYLTSLANFYNTTSSAILNANNISDPDDLSIGKRIIIPVIPER